jgi:hypothetical protein
MYEIVLPHFAIRRLPHFFPQFGSAPGPFQDDRIVDDLFRRLPSLRFFRHFPEFSADGSLNDPPVGNGRISRHRHHHHRGGHRHPRRGLGKLGSLARWQRESHTRAPLLQGQPDRAWMAGCSSVLSVLFGFRRTRRITSAMRVVRAQCVRNGVSAAIRRPGVAFSRSVSHTIPVVICCSGVLVPGAKQLRRKCP